ncbi:MAG: endolytic transglycosylase MltG [Methylobacteriaceae bacterium]|nr:endolytic transglycosylase MltG [Methylobacteriaceae bacterium]MCC0006351.1 endolytic transglycosylase MltG [Methylobacteriaceae bacterium]
MSTVEPDKRETPPPAPAAAARGGIFSRRRSLKSPSEALQPEAAPPPPEPKKKKRRDGALSAFSGFLSFLVVLCVAGGVGLVLMQRKMREPGPLPNDKVVYVAPGTEVPDIIALLEKEGVIDNSALLNIELLVEGARSKLKAGEYLFRQNASLREVLDTLVNGRQILHAVTIPEGLTSQQIVERLRASDVLIGDLKDIPPEGSLLPETYKVARGTNVRDLVRKMQDSEKKLLARVWAQRSPDLPLRSPHEMLTLASIVEKETGKADERPRVAAVFINRLHKRMRLQSDPTIVYGLVGGRGTLGRGILASEVQKWTPYNTYAIDGLPPGPIANPGRAALEAVANPSRTQELYFVADGTGGHVFASSLDEHNRNVVRWRQIEREKGAATNVDRAIGAPPPAPPAVRPGQRGEAEPAANFGRLAALADPMDVAPEPSLAPAEAVKAIDRVAPNLTPADELKELASFAPQPWTRNKPLSNVQFEAPAQTAQENPAQEPKGKLVASFDDPGIKVRGVDGDDTLDGPMNDSGSPELYPVPAKTLAEQRAQAAKLGLPQAAPGTADAAAAPPAPVAGQPRKPVAFDASEGTALDPLRNKSWDLNTAKSVSNALAYH